MNNSTPGLQAAVKMAEGMRMIPGLWDRYLSIPNYPASPFEILFVTYSSCGIWTTENYIIKSNNTLTRRGEITIRVTISGAMAS